MTGTIRSRACVAARRGTRAWRWVRGAFRAFALAAIALDAAGCSYLVFLKPEAVPRERGRSRTWRGPAFRAEGIGPGSRTAVDPRADWAAYTGSYAGARFSPLDQITSSNVTSLRPVCTFDVGKRTNMQTGPIVVDGVLYFTTVTDTYAVDATTCALRWRHTYHYSPAPPFDPNKVNRGVAYLDTPDGPRLFRGANDGRVLALDARTGRELWNVVAGSPRAGETFPAAPIAWGGLVFIGNAGGDNFGVLGRMMAFDARTGGRVWSFDLVPSAGEASLTWPNETERVPRAGGATWTSYALDTAAGTLYVPTGNAAPDFLGQVREGSNLYTTSVVALDARTGTLRTWHKLLERDVHDWDVAAAPALLTTARGRSIVAAAGKDGYVYAIDRASGERRFRTPVATMDNVDAPLTKAGTRFCPGVNGGVEWNGPAFSPATNLLYVNSIDWCTTVKLAPARKLKDKRGLPWTGSAQLLHPFGVNDKARRGWLTAVDADDGTVRWRHASPTPLVAGVVATAGGVVLSGDLRGGVFALDARTGAALWRFETRRPVGGGVLTYSVGGRQYVAVAAGMHSPESWRIKSRPARVIVFALP
jgi:alcohol dehydrogenase (cytochrome c)